MRKSERLGVSFVLGQEHSDANAMLRAALLAEKSGFTHVFVPEHYYDRESSSILGAIASSTRKVRLACGVINPFSRYPSLIAMMTATLDELSGGRFILGLGSGGVIGALRHGIPSEIAGQVYERPLGHMKELIMVVRRLLVGELMTFEGEYYKLDRVQLHFRPVQRQVPIYLGQQGPKMMELAGQIADGVIITLCATVPYVKDILGRVEESERASGRKRGSVDFAARIITCLSRDRGKAIRAAKQLVGRVFIHPGARPVMEASDFTLDIAAIKTAVEAGRGDRLGRLVPDSVVETTTATGTRRDVRRKVEEFRDAGVTLPLIVPIGRNFLDVVRAFA